MPTDYAAWYSYSQLGMTDEPQVGVAIQFRIVECFLVGD